MTKKPLVWVFRAVLGGIVVVLLGTAIFLALVIWDARRAERALTEPAAAGEAFVRRGPLYYSADPAMVASTFAAEKKSSEFRVFVLGSSEAMGTPYVNQSADLLTGRVLGMPNEGGISTWLAKYLERLLPEYSVTVVNAAKGGRDLRESVAVMRDVLKVGRPDLIVLLDGNNERKWPNVVGLRLRDGADLQSTVDELSSNFALQLSSAAALAREYRVPAYVLTVPNNLGDWLPEDNEVRSDPDAIQESMSAHRPPSAMNALDWALLGRKQENDRSYELARRSYIRAKDLDRDFLRTRSPWNESIRSLKSPYVHVVDMERILFGYAPNGIPGKTLFHDYCHMTLAANRIVAFELAKRLRLDRGWGQRPLALADASLELFTSRQLRRLYWVKAFKWTRAQWSGAGGQIGRLNAQTASDQYHEEMRALDRQIVLLGDH